MTKTIKKKPHTGAYKFRVAMAVLIFEHPARE